MSDVRITAGRREPADDGGTLEKALRAKHIRVLVGASLTFSLLLGGAVVSVDRLHSPSSVLDHPASPVTDQQSKDQVVDPARQIVTFTGLQTASAGYELMSCKDRDDPPYQGAIYLTFRVPAGQRADSYFGALASALGAHGWSEGPPPNDHAFATIFSKDAVTVTIYRDSDDPGIGVLRVYGQCRNLNDHRHDATSWADVTGEIVRPG